jgi:hypothetical protein
LAKDKLTEEEAYSVKSWFEKEGRRVEYECVFADENMDMVLHLQPELLKLNHPCELVYTTDEYGRRINIMGLGNNTTGHLVIFERYHDVPKFLLFVYPEVCLPFLTDKIPKTDVLAPEHIDIIKKLHKSLQEDFELFANSTTSLK